MDNMIKHLIMVEIMLISSRNSSSSCDTLYQADVSETCNIAMPDDLVTGKCLMTLL